MNPSPITWYELSIVIGAICAAGSVVATFVLLLWNKANEYRTENKKDVDRIYDSLTNFRVQVAREYATNEALITVEERLSKTLNDAIDRLIGAGQVTVYRRRRKPGKPSE